MNEPEYFVELMHDISVQNHTPSDEALWCFFARMHGLENAMAWAATAREVSKRPARVVPVPPNRRVSASFI